jgi:succinoglycan biosynthesis transport protein ExoP
MSSIIKVSEMERDEEKREIDLMEYWQVIEKRKRVFVTFFSAVLLFALIFTFAAVPRYKATATLYIEEDVSRVISIEDEFGNPRQVTDMRAFNTQLEMLKSKNLAARVAERMNLLSRPEMLKGIKPGNNFLSTLKNIVTLRWLFSSHDGGQEQGARSPSNPYLEYAGVILANLELSPRKDTKLVDLSYTSRDARLSADIVNAYSEEFKEFSSGIRYERTEKFSNDLSKQIDNLRVLLEERERGLQKYGEEQSLTLSDPESEEESAAFTAYRRLSDAYNQAVIERNRIGATYSLVKDSDIDSLPNIDDPRIQQLHTEYLTAKDDYEEKSRTFLSNHPALTSARDRRDRARKNLETAIQSIESDFNVALQNERNLKRELERQESDITNMQSAIVYYKTLNYDVKSLKTRLNSLLNIQTQVDVSKELESLKASNISVVDSASAPKKPVSPDKTKNLVLALLFGLFGGVGLCFLLDYLDNTVKGPEEVEKLAGLPSLGVIPLLEQNGTNGRSGEYAELGMRKGHKSSGYGEDEETKAQDIELINYLNPGLPIADDYRTIRTSILLSYAEASPQIIAFTSSLPVEGKSSTLVNLAVAFSQLDKKVLVIDSDLRKPRLHRIFKIGNMGGLSSYLAGKIELKEAIHKTSIENFWLLPSGPIPPNPSELLNSSRMKRMLEETRGGFDVVLLDTPPVLASIDAVILSTLVDGTVLVLKAGEISRKPFLSAVEELKRANGRIMGVVFNGLKTHEGRYFYRGYYPYYRYGYYGAEKAGKSFDRAEIRKEP